MRWLQWSKTDLANGLGGVEVHARSLARELKLLGVDAVLSSDPEALARGDWDVIQFHGSTYVPVRKSKAIRVHTLHGTTFGRMVACREFVWPGGYAAWSREIRAVVNADVVLSVHPRVSLYRLAARLGKVSEVCWNGWDAGGGREALPANIATKLGESGEKWLFVGRGDDAMKGADRVKAVLDENPDLLLFAAPGLGFEDRSDVIRTGLLSSSQVGELMAHGDGLLIPSRYEGHSLVVLEALAAGLVVVATPVGGVPFLNSVEGLEIVEGGEKDEILSALERARKDGLFTRERKARRIEVNRSVLPKWSVVARVALAAVQKAFSLRGGTGS